MGIFSSKKKVYVASTPYVMSESAAAFSGNPTFMQTAVTSSLINGDSFSSVGIDILNSHFRGPRQAQKKHFNWANKNYSMGVPIGSLSHTIKVDPEVVRTHLSVDPNITIKMYSVFVDGMDETYYAEQHIFSNYPELANVEWAADYNVSSSFVSVQFPPGTQYPIGSGTSLTTINIPLPGFNSSKEVLVAYYTETPASGIEGTVKLYVYELGTGNPDFDAMRQTSSATFGDSEFYPVIPLRIDNRSPFDFGSPARAHEDIITKAYEEVIGGDISDIIDEIESNNQIDDIDYAYLIQGVCLNTDDPYGKKYIHAFLQTLGNMSDVGKNEYDAYTTENATYGDNPTVDAQSNLLHKLIDGSDERDFRASPQSNTVKFKLPGSQLGNLDFTISWTSIEETDVQGKFKSTAKVGEVDIFLGETYTELLNVPFFGGSIALPNNVEEFTVVKQIDEFYYQKISVRGFLHKNLIYDGKSVDIRAHDAFNDREDSGFILPLHEPTIKRMGLVDATELSRNTSIIVFNSYQVVKTRWYERGIFKAFLVVLLIVVVVVITVVTAGAGTPGAIAVSGGILGSSVAIGTALGFSGILALAVGTAVNVVAAMIVSAVVTKVATAVLGQRIGSIVGAIVSVFVTGGLKSIASGGNFMASWTSMGNIDKIINLTNAATSITGVINQNKLQDIAARTEAVGIEYQDEVTRLQKEFDALGFGNRVIDPMMLTDFTNPLSSTPGLMGLDFTVTPSTFESPEAFASRTLMTADDMIRMSQGLIDDFADATLTLPGLSG